MAEFLEFPSPDRVNRCVGIRNRCDALRDLVPKPATLLKLTLLHGCFSRLLNCAYSTKSCNASQMFANRIKE